LNYIKKLTRINHQICQIKFHLSHNWTELKIQNLVLWIFIFSISMKWGNDVAQEQMFQELNFPSIIVVLIDLTQTKSLFHLLSW
jgi:hypothetical protein